MSEHDRYREDMAPYALGALESSERLALERHLEDCADCRLELDQLRVGADALARSVESRVPPASLKRALLRSARTTSPRRRRRLVLSVRVPVVTTAVMLAGLAVGYGLTRLDSSPPTRVITASVDRTVLTHARATLAVGPEGDYLRVVGIPPPPRGRVYEAWVGRGRTVTPAGLFTSSNDQRAVTQVSGSPGPSAVVMVTVEPARGSPSPTTAPLITARL